MAINNQKFDEVYKQAIQLSFQEQKALVDKLLQRHSLTEKERIHLKLSQAGLAASLPEGLKKVAARKTESGFQPIRIKGPPLSKTIIEDRR